MVQKRIIDQLINLISSNHNYSNEQLAEMRYGFEAIYLTITKTIVIYVIALFLNVFWQTVFLSVLYAIIRGQSYGMHSNKTWVCLLSSLLFFLLPAILLNMFILNLYLKIILAIIALGSFLLWSPADTHKRPILQKEKRLRLKIISSLICLIFIGAAIVVQNNFITNALIYIVIMQAVVISPILYKLFKHPYANYKNYKERRYSV